MDGAVKRRSTKCRRFDGRCGWQFCGRPPRREGSRLRHTDLPVAHSTSTTALTASGHSMTDGDGLLATHCCLWAFSERVTGPHQIAGVRRPVAKSSERWKRSFGLGVPKMATTPRPNGRSQPAWPCAHDPEATFRHCPVRVRFAAIAAGHGWAINSRSMGHRRHPGAGGIPARVAAEGKTFS